jgi:hypothetical protein
MVQNIINLEQNEDRILNIIKAQHGLKNKSDAVSLIIQIYSQNFLENELKPEYLKKLENIRKGKYIKFNSIEDLRKATS